jgi:medium-chain acyl-[acyl-carrier-protein] hydrolase
MLTDGAPLTSRWLVWPRPPSDSVASVVLFPHAGSGAAPYIRLARAFDDPFHVGVVRLPARENRVDEHPMTSMTEVVGCMTEVIVASDIGPLALFGHCSGAWLAVDTARALVDCGREPLCLYVSASAPPHLPPSGLPDGDDEDELVRFLAADGYTSAEVLASPESARLALRSLQADVTMIRGYTPVDRPPLTCPIVAWYGVEDDPAIRDSAHEWRSYTTGELRVHELPGAHFSLWADDSPLLDQLQQHFRDVLSRR